MCLPHPPTWQVLSWLALLTCALSSLRAHDAFAEYVLHRVLFGVNAQHVEVTVELTFFENWSARERKRIDQNRDGRLQRAEVDDYVRKQADEVKSQVGLLIGGRRVALVPLYDPEVDLHGRNTVDRAHHRLRLRFFAATPPDLASGTTLVFEDGLWPEAKRMGDIETAGNGFGAFASATVTNAASPPGAQNPPLRFTARYVKPPGASLSDQ